MNPFNALRRLLKVSGPEKQSIPIARRASLQHSFEPLEPRSLLAFLPLAPIANDDFYSTTEDQILVGNVIAGPGGGADNAATPDLPLRVVELNGQASLGDTNLELPSGASLLINPDGSFTYDPSTSAALSSIPADGSQQDQFSYTIAPSFSNVIVLGDSLSDQGRLFAATGATFPPDPPYYQGRMSNGPVWIENLAPRLDLPISWDNNFAVAGAATSDANYNESLLGADLPGLTDELQTFLAGLNGQPADPHALYVVWAGANDFFLPFADPTAVIASAVTNLATTVGTLQAVGAKHIAVINMPDLGLTPYALATGQSQPLTALSSAFNAALASTLAGPEFGVILIDAFGSFQQIAANPEAYGLKNAVSPAFDGTTVVSNPDDYFFWDAVHPTAAGHRLIADAVFDALTSAASVTIDVGDDTTPPELRVENYSSGSSGQLELHLSAADASAADQAAMFAFTIDWGDGSPVENVQGPSNGVVATHDNGTGTVPVVSIVVTDQDGDSSEGFHQVVVWASQRHDQIEVQAIGTQIRIRSGTRLLASANAMDLSRIVVFGLGGNDFMRATGVFIPVEFDGGSGNDYLSGGGSADILRGNAGHDVLFGREGNDWLLGGDGYDLLSGGQGEDILDGEVEVDWQLERTAVGRFKNRKGSLIPR